MHLIGRPRTYDPDRPASATERQRAYRQRLADDIAALPRAPVQKAHGLGATRHCLLHWVAAQVSGYACPVFRVSSIRPYFLPFPSRGI